MNKQDLKQLIKLDKKCYDDENKKMKIYHRITKNIKLEIRNSIINSRRYRFYKENNKSIIGFLKCIYYGRKQSKYITHSLLDIEGEIGENLLIYHPNIIISPKAQIGNNVKLHGSNCIGNNGIIDKAPKIGDNVDVGFGATIIGDIEIADDIVIGANALVNKSFYEKGIVIAGIPAVKIKEKNEK